MKLRLRALASFVDILLRRISKLSFDYVHLFRFTFIYLLFR